MNTWLMPFRSGTGISTGSASTRRLFSWLVIAAASIILWLPPTSHSPTHCTNTLRCGGGCDEPAQCSAGLWRIGLHDSAGDPSAVSQSLSHDRLGCDAPAWKRGVGQPPTDRADESVVAVATLLDTGIVGLLLGPPRVDGISSVAWRPAADAGDRPGQQPQHGRSRRRRKIASGARKSLVD